MRCCRRPNARAAAIRDAGPTPPRSPAARRRSINARRAAAPRFERWPQLLGRAVLPLNPANGVEVAAARRLDRRSALHRLRTVPARPVRWMPSSARRNTCTPCSSSAAPGASCACRPARSIASRCAPGPRPRRIKPSSTANASMRTRAALASSEPRSGSGELDAKKARRAARRRS